jgi:hypothetical protein
MAAASALGRLVQGLDVKKLMQTGPGLASAGISPEAGPLAGPLGIAAPAVSAEGIDAYKPREVSRSDGLAREAVVLVLAWGLATGIVLRRYVAADAADATVLLLIPTYMLFFTQVLSCGFLLMFQERARGRGSAPGAVDALFAFLTQGARFRAFMLRCFVTWAAGSIIAIGFAFYLKRVERTRGKKRMRECVAWLSVALLGASALVFALYGMIVA